MMLIKITTTDVKEKENEDKLGSELKIFAFFKSLYPLFFIPPHVHAILFYSSIAMTTIREQKKRRVFESSPPPHIAVVIIVHAKVQTHERTKNSHKKYAKRQQQSKAVMSTKGIKEDDRLM